MKSLIILILLLGILSGCEAGNYTWTPMWKPEGATLLEKEPNLVDLGPAPGQKFLGYDIDLIRWRLLSCQTREEFDQEVREINAEMERDYYQQQMINAIESLGFDLWHSTYWQEKTAQRQYWDKNIFLKP